MPLLKDMPIEMDPERVALDMNHNRPNEPLLKAVTAAMPLLHDLIEPQAVYTELEVLEVADQKCRLKVSQNGLEGSVQLGPRFELMSQARLAVAGVSTIGPKLDEEVSRLKESGDLFESYALDSLGVMALGEVSKALARAVEARAAEKEWGVGLRLAPGSLVGWRQAGQKELCAFIPLDEIGVSLNPSGVLIPFKSASSLIGMGPGYTSHTVGAVCKYCPRRETCWRRKE